MLAVLVLLLVLCRANGMMEFDTVDFSHEKCHLETLSSNIYQKFYLTKTFNNANGVLEFLVRFKGIADGHIILTTNASDSEPRYSILLGSFNNKVSEIRKGKPTTVEFRMNTPGILSEHQYRGFLIRYNAKNGGLWVYSEGSDIPLLYVVDPQPLKVEYFSFATWVNRVIQVAFDCQAKDTQSSFSNKSNGRKSNRNLMTYSLWKLCFFSYSASVKCLSCLLRSCELK